MLAGCRTLARIPSVSFANTPARATRLSDQVTVLDLTTAGDSVDSRLPSEPPLCWWQGQIDFSIPLPKVSQGDEDYKVVFPPSSLFDPDEVASPPSPTTTFNFPFNPMSDQTLEGMLAELPDMPTTMDSVTLP